MKLTQKQQNKIADLLASLSSAYQEGAIGNILEDVDDYENALRFADDCCNEYREILKRAGYGETFGAHSIYNGFNKYGDETELDEIAREIYYIVKPQNTPKAHYNKIVGDAWKLNKQLEALRNKAQELAERCREHADDYNEDDWTFELANLCYTLEDLASFDLEDAIPETHTKEY